MEAKTVEELPGVGPATAEKLREAGYTDMMAKQTPDDLRRYATAYIIGKPHVVGVLLSPEMRQRLSLTELELATPRGQP